MAGERIYLDDATLLDIARVGGARPDVPGRARKPIPPVSDGSLGIDSLRGDSRHE